MKLHSFTIELTKRQKREIWRHWKEHGSGAILMQPRIQIGVGFECVQHLRCAIFDESGFEIIDKAVNRACK